MFFNPLFIDTNSAGAMQNQKSNKLGKSQYLFSDIIKISLAQNTTADSETAPSFNLSLIDNLGSISSLFSAINSNAVNSAVKGKEDTQNGDSILVNFLQYAFINQVNPETKPVDLKEMLKDKELLLSKESLTKSLSQLLQMYRTQTQTGKGESGVSANPETLAESILQSIDENGKAILNFNNNTSQIKVELTKLNTAEKELFISTKIIPMMITQKENSTGMGEIKNSTGEIQPQVKANESVPLSGGVNQDPVAKENEKQNNIISNGSVKLTADLQLDGNIQKETKITASAQTLPVIEKPAVEAAAPALNQKSVTDTQAVNPAPVNANSKKEKNVSVDEYKVRVVEVNSETAPAEKDTKIFTMTPVEKNLLKKTTITYSSENNTVKKPDPQAANQTLQTDAKPEGESIKTVKQAEKSILKTNSMLFEQNPDEKGTADISKQTGTKKEISAEMKENKTNLKVGSAEGSKVNVIKGDAKEDASTKIIKNVDLTDDGGKQLKTESSKTIKQNMLFDDTKTKTNELKKEVADTTTQGEKKTPLEVDKSSLKQEMNSGQKDSSDAGQNNSDKKSSDNKQFVVQNISDKEKINVFKDDTLKDLPKQTDVTKTIKTYEIIKEIKSFIELGNKSSMTLKIMPENLGSVKINIDMVKNMVQARIDVDNESVKQFVQTNLDSLKQSLNQSGVNLNVLQVNVSSSDQKQQRYVSPHRRKGGGLGKEAAAEEGEVLDNKKILGYNSYDYLA